MESADRVLNIEATFDWDDVGSWISVAKYLEQDDKNNSFNCELNQIGCHESDCATVTFDAPGAQVTPGAREKWKC